MALKDKWQQDRIGRQQGVQERQQQVQTTLSLWQQERQNQALDDQESRQGFVTGVQQQTQELLTNISTERLWVAQQQREQLENFIQQLSQEVGEFLQQTIEERSQVAAQLHQQLSEFREDLEHRVTDLLANYQKQRLEARETLLEDLAIFRHRYSAPANGRTITTTTPTESDGKKRRCSEVIRGFRSISRRTTRLSPQTSTDSLGEFPPKTAKSDYPATLYSIAFIFLLRNPRFVGLSSILGSLI